LEAKEQDRAANFLVLDGSPRDSFTKRTIAVINDFESKSQGSMKVNSE